MDFEAWRGKDTESVPHQASDDPNNLEDRTYLALSLFCSKRTRMLHRLPVLFTRQDQKEVYTRAAASFIFGCPCSRTRLQTNILSGIIFVYCMREDRMDLFKPCVRRSFWSYTRRSQQRHWIHFDIRSYMCRYNSPSYKRLFRAKASMKNAQSRRQQSTSTLIPNNRYNELVRNGRAINEWSEKEGLKLRDLRDDDDDGTDVSTTWSLANVRMLGLFRRYRKQKVLRMKTTSTRRFLRKKYHFVDASSPLDLRLVDPKNEKLMVRHAAAKGRVQIPSWDGSSWSLSAGTKWLRSSSQVDRSIGRRNESKKTRSGWNRITSGREREKNSWEKRHLAIAISMSLM